MDRLPNFVCVGAQKSGTTSLHDIISKHSDVFLPETKEAHFFDVDEKYRMGVDWWLDNHFSTWSGESVAGVFTPEYLFYEEVPKRIYDSLGPDVKILIVLRNPVERAYSHFLMSYRRGIETLEFEEALKRESSRVTNEYGRNHFSYIGRGLYFNQVKRYIDLFGADNILIMSFEEDIVQNMPRSLIKVQQFIGVKIESLDAKNISNPASEARFKLINKWIYGKSAWKKMVRLFIPSSRIRAKFFFFIDSLNRKKAKKKSLDPSLKLKLYEAYFSNDVRDLEKLTEKDFSYWKGKGGMDVK